MNKTSQSSLNKRTAIRLTLQRILLTYILIVICFSFAIAQEQLSGTIRDSITKETIPGANILIKGTTRGVVTDLNGFFTIQAKPGDVLEISSIGYKAKQITVHTESTLSIQLVFDSKELEEVVVIGYGTMKKSDLTGAVVSISEEDLQAEVLNSVDQAIQGKAAGVQVSMNSGSPSAATSIRIRGINSLRNNEPLYVIDGVPVQSDASETSSGFNWAGGGNGQTAINILSTINPSDITSVEILKDASAAAIYGSRGANGVVLITTKKGREGKAKIEYDFNYGIQTPAKLLEVMNLREYAAYQNDLADKGYITQRPEFGDLSLVPEEGTNWQKELFQPATLTEHNLSISGGNEKTQYAISGGYKNQDGLIVGSDFKRATARINLSTQANNWLLLGTNITVSRNYETLNLTDSDDGVITTALLMSPYQEVRGVDGTWTGPHENDLSAGINPVAKANEFTNEIMRTRLLGSLWANIKILPDLQWHTEMATDLSSNNNYNFLPAYEWGTSSNTVAKSRRDFSNSTFWMIKNYFTWTKSFSQHHITIMLGQEAQKAQWEGLMGQRESYVTNDIQELSAGGTDNQLSDGYAGSTTQASFFGRANYNLREKYLATFTYRADGSAKFGPNNKWGYFPSFALAWNLGKEDFTANINWLTNLKLRAGWGIVGNDAIGHYSYGSTLKVVPTPYGGGFLLNNIPNSDVRWESTNQWNIGVDLSMLRNRIEVIAEYYQKYTKDMLMVQPVPDYLGTLQSIGQGWQGIQPPYSNMGEMENKGFELTLNTVNIQQSKFSWNSSITFSHNKNKVTDLGVETAAVYRKVQWYDFVTKTGVGQPVGQFYGYVVDGIFQSVDEVNNSPVQGSVSEFAGTWQGDIRFKDLNDDGIIDDNDRTYIGDPNPDFTYGLNNTLKYRQFDLIIFMNGSYGNDIFNFQRIRTEAMSNLYNNQLKTITNRWTSDNTATDMPRLVEGDPNQNSRISSRYIEDGSYLRISNITLGYSVPNILLSRTPITKFRIYAKIQNAYTFTNYSGYDPEVGSFNQDALLTGVDNGRYPLPRTFLFGFNLTF